MDISMFEQNLNTIERLNPSLAQLIREATIPSDCDYKPAQRNLETAQQYASLRLEGNLVHSNRNPYREATRLVDTALPGRYGPRVLLFEGFGLGYQVEYAVSALPNTHCIVFETDPGLVRAALLCRDLGELLSNERFSLVLDTDPQALAPLLHSVRREELSIVRLRTVYVRHRHYYNLVDRTVENILRRQEVNHNTLVRFGRRWVRNLAANLPVIAEAAPVSRLEGRFRGFPALLLAGGPSLDQVLPLLPEIASRAVVVAVDTSLQACIRAGVEPDYAVIVDPQYWNTRHLDDARSAECEIVSESSTHPRVFSVLNGPVSMCSSLFPLGSYIEDEDRPFGKLGAGGSVSTTAWDFVRYIGCSPIFCAGLDLGFPGRSTHFRGSFFEARALSVCRRFFPVETMAFDYLHSGQTEHVTANDGGSVLSDRRMNIYQWWFETQVARYPETETRNLSRRGMAIPGIPAASVEELLEQPVHRSAINHIRDSHAPPQRHAGTQYERKKRIGEKIETLAVHLHELESLAFEASQVAVEAATEHTRRGSISSVLLQKLDAYDEHIRANKYRDIAGFLMQQITEQVRSGRHENPIDASRLIYEGLAESCTYHRKVLERGLLKLRANRTDSCVK